MSMHVPAVPSLSLTPAATPDHATTTTAALVRQTMLDLVPRLRRGEARDVTATFAIQIEDVGVYTLRLADGHCVVVAGAPSVPDVEVSCDVPTFLDFTSGLLDPISAFQAGQFRVHGDLNLAIRLQTMFQPTVDADRTLTTRHTNVQGMRIESLVQGHGEVVLLLHGLAASKVSFLPTLEDLSLDHEVHALDLPGFGKSDKPLPRGRRYTMAWFADVVRDYLTANSIARAHLVGNSMGGRVALETGLRHPHVVQSVTGLCPAVSFDVWQRWGPVIRASRFEWFGLSPMAIPNTLLTRAIELLFHDARRLPDDNIRAAAQDVQLSLTDRRYRLATMSAARHLGGERASGSRGYWSRVGGLTVPSLWVWGMGDVLVPGTYGARLLRALPSAEVEVWADCGHVPQFELPERTHARVRTFLAGGHA